ncbi:MAG: hypothetical protein JXQ73_18325 [Phycisphaerae bacterium]|nr:hypothetical protein [Phycisphaerae bacterium]
MMRILRHLGFERRETDPPWGGQDVVTVVARRSPLATLADAFTLPRPSTGGWIALAAITALWLLLNLRYGYHLEDSVLYLPIAKQQIDPTLYPDNPLIEHLQRMPYPLYKSMGRLLASPLGVKAHVVATVLMRFVFVAVLLAFMVEVTRGWWPGLLAAVAAILQPAFYGTLAWTELISPEFVQSDLGKIVLMLAVVVYLRGGLILTALLLGVGFNLHPIFGVATAAMLVPDALWRLRRFRISRIVVALVVGVLFAAPTVLEIGRSLGVGPMASSLTAPATPDGGHVEMVRFFNYFHVFPSMFHRWEYVHFLGLASAGVVAFVMGGSWLGRRRGVFLRFAIGIALWCGVGVVFVELLPRTLAMQMMPFRLTYAVRLLATAFVVAAALEVMQRRPRFLFLLMALWLATILVGVKYTPWVTIPVAAWLLLSRRDRWSLMAMLAALLAAGMVAWIDPAQLPSASTLPRMALLVAIMAWVISSTEKRREVPSQEPPEREGWPVTQAGRLGWLAVIIVAGTVAPTRVAEGTWMPQLRAKPWQSPGGYDVDRDPWQNVMNWARTQTKPDTLFITPPDLFGWTYYSERNTLATYQLGMQSVWDRRYAPVAKARLLDIGVEQRWAPGSNYHAFSNASLLAVARKYGVGYVVWKREESNRMPCPVAYQNDGFLVYDLRETVPGSGRSEVKIVPPASHPATAILETSDRPVGARRREFIYLGIGGSKPSQDSRGGNQ